MKKLILLFFCCLAYPVGTWAQAGTNSETGQISFVNFQNIRIAAQFAGADWCAKVVAADTDLGAAGGEIWIDTSAGTSACAAGLTLANPNRKLKFLQSGTWQINGPITGKYNTTIEGVALCSGSSGVANSTVIQNNNTTLDAIEFLDNSANNAQDITIQNLCITDGTGGSRTLGAGIHIDGQSGSARFRIIGTRVSGHLYGYQLVNFLTSVVEQNRAESNLSDGFRYAPSTLGAGASTTLVSEANYALSNGGIGFNYAHEITTLTSNSDAAQSNTLGGVFLDNQNGGVFSSTFNSLNAESNALFGFKALNSTNLTINNIQVTSTTGSPGHGIFLDSVKQVVLNSLQSTSNAGYGLKISNTLSNSTAITVDGSRFGSSNTLGPFSADAGASYVLINQDVSGSAATNFAVFSTACANGNFTLSAGWGSTATVAGAAGFSQTCQITITANGSGIAANPTITDTLPQPLAAATIVCSAQMVGGTGSNTLINQTTLSQTAPVYTFNGTPVAGSTYFVVFRCGP